MLTEASKGAGFRRMSSTLVQLTNNISHTCGPGSRLMDLDGPRSMDLDITGCGPGPYPSPFLVLVLFAVPVLVPGLLLVLFPALILSPGPRRSYNLGGRSGPSPGLSPRSPQSSPSPTPCAGPSLNALSWY